MTDQTTPTAEPRLEVFERLAGEIPFTRFLGIKFATQARTHATSSANLEDDLLVHLPYRPLLIGNPLIPAIHGGVTAALLEVTAISGLLWSVMDSDLSSGLPRTIDLTVDYLRSGKPMDCWARARVNRSGRRYASVHVEAWQDDPSRLFAQATGHFLMPEGLRRAQTIKAT